MRPQVGQVINNKYRLLRLIGDGGMGSVYEARHEVLGTSVALKFLHPELLRRAGLVQRFLQEARVSAQIQSPHVVRVTDVDQTPAGAFIVMEYLEGKSLQTLYEDLYKKGEQLAYADALEYAMQMLEGLEAAHKQGVVHRDLKPDNVMITPGPKGRPLLKLLDFGIAKLKIAGEDDRGLTRPGVIMGTPEYMAPEQAFSADAVDARADIFSLGVMIFEMLAGRRPVGGDEPQQIAAAYLSGRIANLTDLAPAIAPELSAVVHKAMGALVANRWQSVTAFRDALEPFAAAAKAPSALPAGGGASLSNPGVSRPPATPEPAAVTPPATNVGAGHGHDAAAAAIPMTIAPDHAGRSDATNPADPPVMSVPNDRPPTPLGGFGLAGDDAAGFVPPTKSASPYVPEQHGGIGGATEAAQPLDLSPRPGGTAIADGSAPALGLGHEPPFGSAEPALPAYTPPVVAAPFAPAKPKRKSGGALSSLPAILLLAAAASAAVVGGLYIAQRAAKADDHDEPPDPPPAATTVKSDPPPDVPTATPSQIPASRPPQQPIPKKPLPPTRPSGNPNAPPAPSTNPSSRPPVIPSVLPPIVIPSTFPFAFPFEPPRSAPPRSQPDLPPRQSPREPGFRDPSYRSPGSRDPGYRPRPGREDPWDSPREQPRPRPRPGAMPHSPSNAPESPRDYP